jgi:3-hydroxyacyl-[acyl-carrier-protein] dehydratase
VTFLLVDRLLEVRPGEVGRFTKCCSLSEEWFLDHFPGCPILPGSILLEALRQAATLFLLESAGWSCWPTLRAVERARFLRAIRPGDCLELVVRARGGGVIDGTALLDGRPAAAVELHFDLGDVLGCEREGDGSIASARAYRDLIAGALQ